MGRDIHVIDRLVGQRVRLLRMSRSMSQSALAAKLGVTFQQVQKYEKGTNRISAGKLYEIARVLGVDLADLYQDASGASGVVEETAKPPAPSQIDLSIVSKLSQIRDFKTKRHVLGLISALIDEKLQNEARS